MELFLEEPAKEHKPIENRLPREALWLVPAAMTINPVSIFSGNVASLGLKQELRLSLAYQVAQFWSVF